MRRAFFSLGVLAAALLASGCATTMHVKVESSRDTNQGRPIYMLVRNVDGQALVSEAYEDAAARVFAYPKDPSVQKIQVLLPGQSLDFSLPRPDEGAMAIYFFFTHPGNKWRIPLEAPLPTELIVDLGENNIKRVQVRRK